MDKPTRTGTRVRVPIRVSQVHDLRAFSLNLQAPGFEYVRVESGRLMPDREGRRSFLSGMDRTDHVRIDGAVLGGKGLSGQGVLARVVLRPESPSAHPGEVTFVGGDLRNSRNEALSLSEETGTETKQVPSQFVLKDNYPNPFNPRTTIRYGVPEATHVQLTVYDRLGREVAMLVNQRTEAGIHRVTFHAEDLPTGSYLYRLEADGYTETKSMMIVK